MRYLIPWLCWEYVTAPLIIVFGGPYRKHAAALGYHVQAASNHREASIGSLTIYHRFGKLTQNHAVKGSSVHDVGFCLTAGGINPAWPYVYSTVQGFGTECHAGCLPSTTGRILKIFGQCASEALDLAEDLQKGGRFKARDSQAAALPGCSKDLVRILEGPSWDYIGSSWRLHGVLPQII